MKSSRRFPGKKTGFTLVEMLVSMSIFCLMMALFSQIVGTLNNVWMKTLGKVDNFARARTTLETLQVDLAQAVIRHDLGAFADANGDIVDASGNGCLSFYAERVGVGTGADGRRLSLLSYRQQQDPDGKMSLKRQVLAVGWEDASRVSFGVKDRLTELQNSNIGNEEMVSGIVAFSVKFLDGNGSLTPGFTWGVSKAAVVSLAIVDAEADVRLNAQQREDIEEKFFTVANDLAGQPASVKALWENLLGDGAFWQNYPQQIPGSVKIFERIYRLPDTTGTK